MCFSLEKGGKRITENADVSRSHHLQPQEDNTQQLRLAEYGGEKIQLIKSWAGESLNIISQRRGLHVSHWSVSEFRGLKDCGAGLPRLDRDSYWVHSSLGSDKGLRASDESDNGSRPCLCPTVFGFGKEQKKESRRTHQATAGTISAR